MSKDKRSRMGPESDEYNRFKGRQIVIVPHGELHAVPIVGRLVWVDIYTLGVALDPRRPDNIHIIYKAGILSVGLAEDPLVIAGAKRDTNGVTAP